MSGECRIYRRFNRKISSRLHTLVRRIIKASRGAVATEYAFIMAFIALVGATGFVLVGDGLVTYFDGISRTVESAGTNMPNPLGGGGNGGGSSGGSGSGGSGSGGSRR